MPIAYRFGMISDASLARAKVELARARAELGFAPREDGSDPAASPVATSGPVRLAQPGARSTLTSPLDARKAEGPNRHAKALSAMRAKVEGFAALDLDEQFEVVNRAMRDGSIIV